MSVLRPSLNEELSAPESKKSLNLEIFSQIAREYDFITRALSFCQDGFWKRAMIKRLPKLSAPTCVDLACGTGDLSFLVADRYPDGTVTGIDLTPEMVEIANHRNGDKHPNASFQVGDMGNLDSIESGTVDLVTGGYAIRNAPDLQQALQEIYRILKPGGTATFLDFSRSPNSILSQGGYLTLKFWGGFWGLVLHGKPWIYGYIADSLQRFPNRRDLGNLIQRTGFLIDYRKTDMGGLMETLQLIKPEA